MYQQKKDVTFQNQSYYQDASRKYFRQDSPQGLKARLSANWSKIIELFVERKELMKRLAEVLMSENSSKLEQIGKAKNSELKNEARGLKDENLVSLIENAQKHTSSTKSILKTILDSNTKILQQDQSKKSKSYYDQIKRIDTDRLVTINKFKSQTQEINKLIDEERKLFSNIQLLQQQKINVLTSKQPDHIRIAEKIQDQIQRNKLILKNNKTTKDKKKRELAFQIDKIIEATRRHSNIAALRYQQIVQMFGGYDNVEEFDSFFNSFEMVVRNKLQAKKEDEAIVIEIVRRAAWYQKQIEDMQKHVNDENQLFEYLTEAYRKNVTLALLEKAYLTNVPGDRNALLGMVNKCQSYRQLLDKLADEKAKAKWETEKAHQVLDHFEPILRSISTEEKRKQQLKQRIAKIMASRTELQKMEKKQQNFEFELTNLLLQKQAITKPMHQAARKGNLQQYKLKTAQLQKLQQEIAIFTQSKNDHKYKEESSRLNIEIEQINRDYSSIIEEILAGEKEMSFLTFLEKLGKRLMLV